MKGLSNTTGQSLSGVAHLQQSIQDVLTTRIGSRVMRRDYGSRLPNLLDSPLTPGLASELYAATADALLKWEPRFQLSKVTIVDAKAGWIKLALTGVYLSEQTPITIEDLQVYQ
ncbi:MAG: GPW/gp25 family protein [Gammaproteobacteria bacterium]|nr:GPW/gp25 family protein [Gammaproteobacteria bacterium]HQT03407.1 GPW/gp25 family protein [Thiotrichales bacterium]